MAEAVDERPVARPGRCVNHPGAGAVGTCSLCSVPLCTTCAVPVRGSLVGPECLGKVLEVPPPTEPAAALGQLPGDRMALAGFAVVVAVSAFPWSRFGPSSRFFGAWTPHWSLVAASAGLTGLALALARLRPFGPGERVTAATYALLGVAVAVASIIQHRHPPLLTEATWWPWVAALGGLVAVVAALLKGRAIVEARHHSDGRRRGR